MAFLNPKTSSDQKLCSTACFPFSFFYRIIEKFSV